MKSIWEGVSIKLGLKSLSGDVQERRKEEKQKRKAEKARANEPGMPHSLTASLCPCHAAECQAYLTHAKRSDAFDLCTQDLSRLQTLTARHQIMAPLRSSRMLQQRRSPAWSVRTG